MLDGIGGEFVHQEREGLCYPRAQHEMGTNSLDPVGKGFTLKIDDLGEGCAFETPGYKHRLTATKGMQALYQHVALFGKRSRSRETAGCER